MSKKNVKMNEKKISSFRVPERRKEFSILHSQQHLFVLKRSSCESNEAYFVVLLPCFRGKETQRVCMTIVITLCGMELPTVL